MVYQTNIGLRWSDGDAIGHINNAVIVTLFEECRAQALLDHPSTLNNQIVVANLNVDFIAPILYAERTVIASLEVTHIGTKSFTLRQSLYRSPTDEHAGEPSSLAFATATIVIVAFDPTAQKARALEASERDWLLAL